MQVAGAIFILGAILAGYVVVAVWLVRAGEDASDTRIHGDIARISDLQTFHEAPYSTAEQYHDA